MSMPTSFRTKLLDYVGVKGLKLADVFIMLT